MVEMLTPQKTDRGGLAMTPGMAKSVAYRHSQEYLCCSNYGLFELLAA